MGSDLTHLEGRPPQRWQWRVFVLAALLSATFAFFTHTCSSPLPQRCRPYLPNVFNKHSLQHNEPEVRDALLAVDSFVRQSFHENPEIDGLVAAVVTANGAIYETALGPLKANETRPEDRGAVDRYSIFRLASGSKLFAMLEILILRERGALQLDDPIAKYLPQFAHKHGGWANEDDIDEGPITIRHLASHMSGMTREYPRGNMDHWPHSLEGIGPPPMNGAPFPDTLEETVLGISHYPLNLPTSTYPVYSNAGMALLGQIAVVANAAAERSQGVDVAR
uniref:Beta-lactamase-like protein str5 n=1 Tax=Strobilurus tenacellus TaxID=41251 RepID=STR5_STRTC|nr:RecName: Full=Beta-lactamase-like protein str5; AltName: Full=Strobilurin A biosynthesis cluster protein r5 [Strobilurus tenacellus]ATV82115.1 hydrolase 1 [Strobilurus tenacellus]